jgi:hypothetical protein
MHTSVVFFALSGFLAAASAPGEPAWLNEYGKARQQGAKEEKPLAVFIGSGKVGWNQLSREGQLDPEVKRLLADHYVCLYIDTNQANGKRLADAFEIHDQGIVISTHTGQKQAFRNEGTLGNQELARYLRRYADPGLDLQYTETAAVPRASFYQPSAPTMGGFAPSFGGGFAPAFGGGGRGGC